MSDQQRCGTCRHWSTKYIGNTTGWGDCSYAMKIVYPFWIIVRSTDPVKTTGTEGAGCDAWGPRQ